MGTLVRGEAGERSGITLQQRQTKTGGIKLVIHLIAFIRAFVFGM